MWRWTTTRAAVAGRVRRQAPACCSRSRWAHGATALEVAAAAAAAAVGLDVAWMSVEY